MKNNDCLHVLFLAYYFPPGGGAGSQRPLKFTKYLPQFNIKPIIIAGPITYDNHFAPEDTSLCNDIPNDIQITRISPTPKVMKNLIVKKSLSFFFGTTPHERWWAKQAFFEAEKIISIQKVDLILATLAPYCSARVAHLLGVKYKKPWILDLRDPWALDENRVYSSALHRKIDLQNMRRELLAASLIIMNTPQAKIQVLNTFPSLQHKNIEVITNGFDSDDFQKQFQNRSDHHFRIVHTGFLHTSIGLHVKHNNWYYKILGKCPPSVNYLTRSHLFLIKAAENLVARFPNFLDDFELILAGHNSEEDISIIRSSVLFKNVKFLGYIPHDKTIELLKSTDLLFLPMQDLPPGIKSTIVPGKTYEYMAASRPILAAVPDGDVCDFLLECGGNVIVKPSDITSLEKAVESFYITWRNGHSNLCSRNYDFIKRFDRRVLTERLASILKNLLSN